LKKLRKYIKKEINMTSKERINTALSHKELDRVPIGYVSTIEAKNKLKDYLKIDDDDKLLKRLGVDYRFVFPEYIGPKGLLLDFNWDCPGKDIWGVERREIRNVYGAYREIVKYPLKDIKDVGDLDRYPWPKVEWFDFDGLPQKIAELNRDDEYAIILNGGSVFEQSWYLRGLDQFLMDLLINPDITCKIIENVFNFWISIIIESMRVIEDKIDAIFFGDDVASQEGMLISLETWRKWVKPWHKKFYSTSHYYGKITMYHSCGSVEPIIEELIDIGLDVLNPLQFSARGYPCPEKLKEKYGDRLSFLGGMDIQTILPFYSIEDIKKETERLIRILGKNGGYIIQTTHNIQADTPPEKIMAMYDTALNFNY
jgi:uroporphyrinogen decarboxylase